MEVRRKDGLRKKRRQLWLEREKEGSQNNQPMHDGKSSGPLAIHSVLCNRKWARVVSAICGEWQRGTHAYDKAMQPVKPLWSINAQANRLTVNGIDTTNTTPIS